MCRVVYLCMGSCVGVLGGLCVRGLYERGCGEGGMWMGAVAVCGQLLAGTGRDI